MSALELYAIQALRLHGAEHMWAIQSLRSYIKLCPDQELINYINQIVNLDILRTLQEAGIRQPAYKTLVSRMNLLIKEQEEAKK